MKEIRRVYSPGREVNTGEFEGSTDALSRLMWGWTTIEYRTIFGRPRLKEVNGDQRHSPKLDLVAHLIEGKNL